MQREYFGPGLSDLDATTFARCVVLAAAVPGPLSAWLEGRTEREALDAALAKALGESPEPTLRLRLTAAKRLALLWNDAARRQRLLEALPSLWSEGPGRRAPALVVSGGHATLDRDWLLSALLAAGDLRSLLFESPQPGSGLWEWPLRVGFPATQAGYQLNAALSDVFRHLQHAEMLGAQDAVLDLLLLPDALPHAMDMPAGGRVVADAVLVLGGAGAEAQDGLATLAQLQQRYRSGLAGVLAVPQAQWRDWFDELIRQLAHNRSLPDVLFDRNPCPAQPPRLLGDAAFVASTRIADAAGRLAQTLAARHAGRTIQIDPLLLQHLQLDPATASADDLARQLASRLPFFEWFREDHEATGLVRLREALETQLGRLDTRAAGVRLSAPKMAAPRFDDRVEMAPAAPPPDEGFAMSAPPEEPAMAAPPAEAGAAPADAKVREARHVQADFFALPLPTGAEPVRLQRLLTGIDCRMRAHIGVPRQDSTVVAPQRLDESLLPDSDTGHTLSLVYCPLTAVADSRGGRAIPAPVQATLHLPPCGDSTAVEFTVNIGDHPERFRARLIVLHENRVLQTLLLRCDAEGRPALEQENVYTPALRSSSADAPADLAFVINHNLDGEPGLAAVRKQGASYLEPDGLRESTRIMRQALSRAAVAAVGEEDRRLDAEANLKLMRLLATHGAMIVKDLQRDHPGNTLQDALRIQMVEAKTQSYFPIEFLYSGPAPRPSAALCPNAVAALSAETRDTHLTCPNHSSRDFVCPAAFWGFEKCIERHPAVGKPTHDLSVPEPGEDTLGPFTSALLAASDRAKSQMTGADGLPATVARHVATVTEAASWAEWEQQVAARKPDLMVLMPHSAQSEQEQVATLEVSKDELLVSLLDDRLVRGQPPPAKGPLVMLLGCATQIADIPFLNFVKEFHLNGAPVVIGTLSTIHGTQAALLAERLLGLIADPQHRAERIDEALLKVKRGLLAEGHGVAFTLISYGHSSWRL